MFPHDSSGGGYEAISGDVGASGNYGLREFRAVERWRFLARPFLSAEKKAKISIGVRKRQQLSALLFGDRVGPNMYLLLTAVTV